MLPKCPTSDRLLDATPVYVAAFARTVNKLYVAGGECKVGDVNNSYKQTISLDLTIPWNNTSPAWTQLAKGPVQSQNTAVFSPDEQTLLAFHIDGTNSPWKYNIQNDSWQEWSAIKFENAEHSGIGAVMDPGTGLIYLAGGYEDVDPEAPYRMLMDIVDPITQTFHTIDLPDPQKNFHFRSYYGCVWSKYRNSILYWGGYNTYFYDPWPVDNEVTELVPSTMTWSMLKTRGGGPARRYGHCMVANEEGDKIVIYGGNIIISNGNDITTGQLWVLDLVTLTWSQGPSGPTREVPVCTIAGDYFLIWGGMVNHTVQASSEMLIFNFNTSTYVKHYTPPAYYKDLKPPPPPPTRTKAPWDTDGRTALVANNKDPDRPPLPTRAIVGGVVGGLVLVGIVVGMFFMRQRWRQGQPQDSRALKKENVPKGQKGLLERVWGGNGKGRDLNKDPNNHPQEIKEEDDEQERTFRALEEEQRDLDLQRQTLVQQHQEFNPRLPTDHKRAPTALIDDKAEIISSPTPPSRPGPNTAYSVSYSPENLQDRKTVQGVTGPIGMYFGDSYVDDGPRRESELAQDVIEPVYDPSPVVNSAIPDVVYELSPDVGMNWTKQRQANHPHSVVPPSPLLEQ